MSKILFGKVFEDWELTLDRNNILVILQDVDKGNAPEALRVQKSNIPRWEAIEIVSGKRMDVRTLLSEICESEHSSCNNNCPVYLLKSPEQKALSECSEYRNGQKMISFIHKSIQTYKYP